MNKEECAKGLEEMADEYRKKLNKHYAAYAMSNNPVKEGDIVEDHIGSIRVDKIRINKSCGSCLPECSYKGVMLTKKGDPVKNGKTRWVFQSNLE
jgi:hypothetical protein